MASAKGTSGGVKFLIFIVVFVLIIGLIIGGAWVFVYASYGIDSFGLIGQIQALNRTVDINTIAPNGFSNDNLATAKATTDDSGLGGLITLTDGVYDIVPEGVSTTLTKDIMFTSQELGAITNIVISKETDIKLNVGNTELDLKEHELQLLQIELNNVNENSCDFNFVFKISTAKIKESMTAFPLSIAKSFIPNDFYFSATATVLKGATPFTYSVEGKDFKVNMLSTELTQHTFNNVNKLFSVGEPKEFAKTVCEVFMEYFVGDITTKTGFVVALVDVGATDFGFYHDATTNYFVIKM